MAALTARVMMENSASGSRFSILHLMSGISKHWREFCMGIRTKAEYIQHLREVGASLTRSTMEYDEWTIEGISILLYPTYAICGGKEVWRAS